MATPAKERKQKSLHKLSEAGLMMVSFPLEKEVVAKFDAVAKAKGTSRAEILRHLFQKLNSAVISQS
jgi:hypothetical protein